MPATGYLTKATATGTDFNGIIGAVINCKYFEKLFTADLSKDNNICTEVRNKVNEIRHFKNMEPGITDADLNNYIDLFIDLLSDAKSLQGDPKAKDARDKLKKLKLDTLVITTEEAGKILDDALTEFKNFKKTMDFTKMNALREMKDMLADARKHLTDLGAEQEKKIFDAGTEQEKKIFDAGTEQGQLIVDAGTEQRKKIFDVGTEQEKKIIDAGTEQEKKIFDAGTKQENKIFDAGTDHEKKIFDAGTEQEKKIFDAGTEQIHRIEEAGDVTMVDLKTKISEEVGTAMKELETEKDRLVTILGRQQIKSEPEIYEDRKHELRHALANHYWSEHNSMPLSPLMPEVDDHLTKFYMTFKMNKVLTKSSSKSVQTRGSVTSYKSLFYNDSNSHKNIYIQGEAGIGKSTFCTKVGLVWSEGNLTECSKKDRNINERENKYFSDETIIDEFDFVFSLALRNVEGECEIEQMIENQIINILPNHTKYDELVPKILDKERCLIILDGLDEWPHQHNCRKSGLIPHRKSWSKTTVLTCTRPWKMNEVCLRDSEISILIQITGITDSEKFTENVLSCLNDKYNTTFDVRHFLLYMKDKQLQHFLEIPVVALQLLCLWHSGHELGDSKCKIYLNVLDMLFGRTHEKSPIVCDDIEGNPNAGVPPCIESTRFCRQHKMLLECLGSLAFHTLYSYKREESLVFKDCIVESHLKSTAALKTALTTGILSQHKSPSLFERRSHFSFMHKTFQEFLAAYYIATHVDESENIIDTLFQVYAQGTDIMEISELFLFVCGLNTEMSYKISDLVMKSFSEKLTNHIEQLHVSDRRYNVGDMTESLQKMILAGYKESISNGHPDPQLALHHVYYYRDISDVDKLYRDRLVDMNIDKIVTLCAGAWRQTCTVDVVKIEQILTQSSSTLSHVCLEKIEDLTGTYLDLFTNISLKSLYLCDIFAQFDIKLNTSSLLYCYLGINKEVEHRVLSALAGAPALHRLDFIFCKNMSVLCRVLPTLQVLHRLDIWDIMIPASLCQVLSTLRVSKLQRLNVRGRYEDPSLLCQALSTPSNLQYIRLMNTDLGDNDILLSNSIREIELHWVKLTGSSVRQLVDRLTQIPHQVICTLWRCIILPLKEQDTIVKHIQLSDMFEIHKYVNIDGNINLHFIKIQTELVDFSDFGKMYILAL